MTATYSGDKTYAFANGPRLTYARPVAAAPVAWLPWHDNTPATETTRFLATPQTASVLEVEIETPKGMPYTAYQLELSPDGDVEIKAIARDPGFRSKVAVRCWVDPALVAER